ncbi:MAG: threonine/serine exporter family protein [Tissierellaceae bacterium]|nr:threonine/serine exporter family protein [Tissierellaceae bacterium]
MNHFTIKNTDEVKKLMNLAISTGETLLKNGAEAYRVEDTMERICKSRNNIYNVNSFVTQTGIFLTFEHENQSYVNFKRVRNVSINLKKISEINKFSRKFVCTNISLDDSLRTIETINKMKTHKKMYKAIFGAASAAFFTLMFGGNIRDFVASFIASYLVITIMNITNEFKLTFFIDNFLGAFLASLFASISIKIGLGSNLDKIIIGSIMYLVPGVATTNAIRDTMSGDSLSGLSKGMEAIFSALAIAFGVGVVLSIYM